MLNLYHPDDPAASKELWHFVYLDGMAEVHNSLAAELFGFDYDGITAPDLVCVDVDQTTLEEGEYDCLFYGKCAIAFICKRFGHIDGRIVLKEEKRERIDRNSDPRNWR